MFRRLAALGLWGLMAQLNFRAADLVCAKHGGESPTAHTAESSQHHSMAMPTDHDSKATDENKSCEIPATRDCCQAIASCAVAFGIAGDISSNAAAIGDADAPRSADQTLASLIRAPEPPPPKS